MKKLLNTLATYVAYLVPGLAVIAYSRQITAILASGVTSKIVGHDGNITAVFPPKSPIGLGTALYTPWHGDIVVVQEDAHEKDPTLLIHEQGHVYYKHPRIIFWVLALTGAIGSTLLAIYAWTTGRFEHEANSFVVAMGRGHRGAWETRRMHRKVLRQCREANRVWTARFVAYMSKVYLRGFREPLRVPGM